MKQVGRGSVLMEFVVVAPLYLVLLGGLFILGELMLNRIRMHVGDRYVVWVGGSRFCPMKIDSNGEKTPDGDWVGTSLRPVFARSIGGDAAVDFKVDRQKGGGVEVNGFTALHMGGVTNMTVALPGWARGMMSATSISSGDAAADDYSEQEYKVNYFRSFVFLRGEATERLSKDVDAAGMISYRLASAVNDIWINQEVGSDRGALPDFEPVKGVLRMLGRFAE